MKILIAEDDLFFRRMLEQLLLPDYQLQVAEDGESAWAALQQSDAPKMAILDAPEQTITSPNLLMPRSCGRGSEEGRGFWNRSRHSPHR